MGVLVCALVLANVACLIAPALRRSLHGADLVKDETHLWCIAQAAQQFAQANREQWLVTWDPNASDAAWAMNTTANLYGQFVHQQLITPEFLVSPVERNPRVGPGKAIPSSYAHQQPTEARSPRLANTYWATRMWFSTRFPEVVGVTARDAETITTPMVNRRSYPIRMLGWKDCWAGNVAYADGHVESKYAWLQNGVTGVDAVGRYVSHDGEECPDLPWLDEPDDGAGTNDSLGIFEKAGRRRQDFVPVWD